jgi:hypothetical protein
MTATVTIGPRERDALHGLMLHRLFILGEQPLELARVEGVSVEQLGVEFGEDLRLMEDLGWTFDSHRETVPLTMPPESLAKTARRLRRDARRAPSEKRHEREPRETDEERWERFQRAVDACEEVLDLLDSPSREDTPPDAVGCPLDPGQELKSYEPVSDGLVLAAVERAECHEGADEIWVFVLAEHLGFEPARHTTRQLRPQLEYLRRAGSLTSAEKLGREYWSLTTAGREELTSSRQAEIVGDLPESPQHREWRHARQKARGRMTEFRELLHDALDDAGEAAASADGAACSGTWFELGERLRWAYWLLGSAAYCLEEWIEPDDARPDIDQEPSSEPARRTTSAWRQKAIEARGARR